MAKKPTKTDEAEAPEGADGAKPAKAGIAGLLRNKLVLAGVGGVLLLAIGGGAAWQFGLFGGEAETEAAAPSAPEKPVHFVDLPEMVVNLATPDRDQYLKIRVALEVGDPELAARITPLLPRVIDTFQTYMRELRPADLDGSAGMFRLKEELTKRVNVAVYPAKIDAVLFKEIVVQ